MSIVNLISIVEDKQCTGCGRKITRGTKAVQQVDQEDGHIEFYHHTKKCCEETFVDYKSITEKEQEMDLMDI